MPSITHTARRSTRTPAQPPAPAYHVEQRSDNRWLRNPQAHATLGKAMLATTSLNWDTTDFRIVEVTFDSAHRWHVRIAATKEQVLAACTADYRQAHWQA